MLYEYHPNPSDVGLDQGLTVHDAIKNPEEWLKETTQAPVTAVKGAHGKVSPPAPAVPQPFVGWEKWTNSPLSNFIPAHAQAQRTLVNCLRTFGVAPWTVPPQQLRAQGHFFYLHVVTLEGETLYLTASAHGFYVNKSTSTKFDPAPRIPGQSSCSLIDLLCFLSPLFLNNYGKLLKNPLAERDMLALTHIDNGLPANPWLAREAPHHPEAFRSQAAFLLTGGTSTDTLESTRDWHDELQTAKEQPRNTVVERLWRDRLINRVYSEYTLAAIRAVPRVAAGEVQAMNPNDKPEAHMFLANNLFISRGADSVGVYPLLGGDEAAHVAVGKDVRNTCLVNSMDVDGLCTLGSVVVDWMGTRWVAQSVVPGLFRQKAPEEEQELIDDIAQAKEQESSKSSEENEKVKSSLASRKSDLGEEVSYRYGGADGPEIIRASPAFHPLFAEVARNLHLSLHDVADAKEQKHSLWLSVECKGLRGADGRKYILDLARLTPVDIEWLEKDVEGQVFDSDSAGPQPSDEKSAYPHKMALLRPELLQLYHDNELRKWLRAQVKEIEAKETEAEKEADKTEAEGEDKKEEAKDKPEKNQELIDAAQFKLSYNPDAFVQFKLGGTSPDAAEEKDPKGIVLCSDEKDPSVAAVRSASRFLRDETIPAFVSEVASGVSIFLDGATLTNQMHGRGINVRYLGLLAQLSSPSEISKLNQEAISNFGPGHEGLLRAFHQITLQEMVVRTSKRVLRSLLKNVEEASRTFFTTSSSCVSHFLNCLVGFSRDASPAAVFETSPLYIGSQPPSWTEITPSSVEESIRSEVKKRYRFCLSSDYFSTSLRKQQVLREVCLRTGVQIKLQDYHFDSSANLNGHAQETSEESVNENSGSASAGPSKKKKGKKSKAAAAAEAERERKPRTTTFEPSDILNLVPIVKDSAPRSLLAEQTFESGRQAISRGAVEDRTAAIELMTQGLQFYEQIYGAVHSETARLFQQYATLLHTFVIVQSQEMQLKVAKAQRENQPEPTEEELQGHPDITIANAMRYQRLAITISERTTGVDSPETLAAYNNLAAFERMEGSFDEAFKSHARALELMDFIHGSSHDHPESVNLVASVGVTMYQAGRIDEALVFLREAYAAALRLYGSESLQVGNLAHELAQVYTMTRDLKAAVQSEKVALRIFEQRLGKEDPTTKEADQFLSGLTSAAVQAAKSEKERQSRLAARGLPNLISEMNLRIQGRPATTSVSAPSASTSSVPVKAENLDEIVDYIQGNVASKPSSASKGKKVRGGRK